MHPEVFRAAKRADTNALRDYNEQNCWLLSAVTIEGNTILHIAAREGHLDLVKWILNNVKKCCSLTAARNAEENTPLHETARQGNDKVVEVLLEHNKSPAGKRNQYGEIPLTVASEHGHEKSVKLLLNATPWVRVFWPRDDRRTCLNAAVYGGHLEVVKSILKQRRPSCFNSLRPLLLVGDEFGATPLHVAVHGEHVEIVREILKAWLDWCGDGKLRKPGLKSWWDDKWRKCLETKKDDLGRCAVHIAAMKGNLEIIDLFLEYVPDCVEIQSTSLQTVVHFAVEFNQFGMVKKLLSENIEASARILSYDSNISGNTVFHLAARKGVDLELVHYLVSFPNVNVNAINDEGLSAFNIASSNARNCTNPNFDGIARILEDAGANESLISLRKSVDQNGNGEPKIFDVDTLVASLIASVTFAAMFPIPGGFNKETGIAKMALSSVFNVFLFSDCLAFFASMSVVIAWIFRERVQTKLTPDRSLLAKLSMLSLGTSIVSTGLAFLTATILATVPRHLEKVERKHDRHAYRMIFIGEMVTAFAAPALAVVFLSLAWVFKYYFQATNERRARLRRELQRVLISALPIAAIVFVILFTYIFRNV